VKAIRKTQLLLVAITAASLVPFLNKAFHIDDPLFLWMAQQVVKHPLDPYGFDLNWVSFVQPMSIVMQNPPLCSYYIAAVASLFGWSEPSLHIAFIFWAIMAVLGTFALARRFCRNPLMAALLTLFMPVFLVSATSVMCDVMMLALWVWAVEFWLAGLSRPHWHHFLTSAVLISAAALTKYFGISLVPLLAVYTVARERRFTLKLAYLLIPIAVLSNYDFVTDEKYGHGLFSAATTMSSAISAVTRPSHLAQFLMGLSFTGGCFFSALFFAPLARKRLLVAAAIGLVGFAAAFKVLITSWIYLQTSETPVWLEGGLFATLGLGILVATVIDLVRQRNPDASLLLLWIIGTFWFATFFNWSITARTFLPITPAVAILTVQHFERLQKSMKYLPVLAAAVLSMLITIADYQQADCGRAAARLFQQRYADEAGKIWFQGHWGFQYYLQPSGATPFDRKNPQVPRGELIVGPFSDPSVSLISPEKVQLQDQFSFGVLPFISTFGLGTGSGFYSSFFGPLPWVINKIASERYYAVRAR
jgi:4-amino-4-deoxy-L-arabinose transferase-like glycosyltransferase